MHQTDSNNSDGGGSDSNNSDGGNGSSILPLITRCSDGYEWDEVFQDCKMCKSGEVFDSVSRTCVDKCPIGTVWSIRDEMCISDGTNAECPIGYVRSSEKTESDCTSRGTALASIYNYVNALFIDIDDVCCLKYSDPIDNNDSNNLDSVPIESGGGTNGRLDHLGGQLDQLIGDTETRLGEVTQAIRDASNDNNNSLSNVVSAINEASDSNNRVMADIRRVNTFSEHILEDINKSLSPPGIASDGNGTDDGDKSKLQKILNQANIVSSDALKSFADTKNAFGAMISANDSPVFVAPVGNCEISFDVLGQHIVISMATFAVFKPYVQLVMNWVLLIYMLQFYTLIARDIAKYFFS